MHKISLFLLKIIREPKQLKIREANSNRVKLPRTTINHQPSTMFISQASIIVQKLPLSKWEQLCLLWEEMAEVAGVKAIFLKDEHQGQEYFRLFITQEFRALLLGKILTPELTEVNITFNSEIIATYLQQLGKQVATHPQSQTNLQSEFNLKLLAILVAENPPATSYPRFGSNQEVLHHHLEQQRILNEVSHQITQNLDCYLIVQMTIQQVQHFLKLDRLVIYQLNVKLGEKEKLVDAVTYEALASPTIPSVLNFEDETCMQGIGQCQEKYRRGFMLTINNIETDTTISPCLKSLMERLQIKAKVLIPIIVQETLWGFLIAHQCITPRKWKQSEIKFMLNIAEYLAIAIYQAQSYRMLEEQKSNLEQQVKKRAEELQEALIAAQIAHRSKSEFIGTMSHELRTPLTCVIGLASTLLQISKSNSTLPLEKQQKYLQTIQDNGKKLLELINDILDLSAVEAGKSLLNIKQISLRHLTLEVFNSLQIIANNQEINLKLDWQISSEDYQFYADEERIKQILYNLLENAIKFTPAGGKVSLRVSRTTQQIIFEIKDTGIGIAENDLPLLFEKFQQLENSKTRTHGGAGLGLALTKQLVELHGGTIEVESTIKQGSLFRVLLPQPEKPQSKNIVTRKQNINFSEIKTIVLVEEEEEIATLICELLTAANYQIIWLMDSSTALMQIKILQPQIVIIDSLYPKSSQISQNLKQLKTDPPIKILLLSHDFSSINNSDFIPDDYLIKPLQPNLLLEKIEGLVDSW
ncbi:MAG: GAF domain-containing protein [Gomphosphaeria aponina SAG 52.96 = DSM 107014]|uniref:histidine kinase n=1 Tax=Gomphosphaeria aponina SAG 52.96 = DSM 107014 TaxID=1521640 RepID=A0A941JQE5_9CHRO|nr:GAF domain-containing protein [Gomphosphaeria aponina SAG 52.96 = DSM 107014]